MKPIKSIKSNKINKTDKINKINKIIEINKFNEINEVNKILMKSVKNCDHKAFFIFLFSSMYIEETRTKLSILFFLAMY